MHASFITLAFFFALSVAAAPTTTSSHDNHPHLERRLINPLTIGLGAGGVHKAKDNEKLASELGGQIEDIHREVERLKATEATLARSGVAPNLVRRQLGTILGAVGIHKSKHTRQEIGRLQGEVGALRHDVNILLEAEHLPRQAGPQEMFEAEVHHEDGGDDAHHEEDGGAPIEETAPVDESAEVDESSSGDDHRLVRRQLGIILGPVAIHKAKKDRAALEALRPEIDHLRVDCARIRTAQEQRLRTLNAFRRGGPGVPGRFSAIPPLNHVVDTHVDVVIPPNGGPGFRGDVMGVHEDRMMRGPTVVHGGATYGADHHHGRRPSSYGRPAHY